MGNNCCHHDSSNKGKEIDLSDKISNNIKVKKNFEIIFKNLNNTLKNKLKKTNSLNSKLKNKKCDYREFKSKSLNIKIEEKKIIKKDVKNLKKSLINFLDRKFSYNILKLNVNLFKKFIKDDFKLFYKIIKPIGQGGFGEIFLVKNKKTKQLRAMKVMNKENISKNNFLLEEFLFLKEFDHPNIIKVFEFYQDKLNYYLLTEYIEGGDLCENLSKIKKFNEKNLSNIMKQLFSVVNYIHSKNIIHRDIKLENLLMVDSKNLEIKLIDFGISKRYKKEKLNERIGSFFYVAPEVILGRYDKRCDIWSCGIIFYILLFNKFPFYSNNKEILFKKILNSTWKIPESKNISKSAIDLLKKLLKKKPDSRINIDECLKHEFIVNVKNLNSSEFKKVELFNFNKLNKIKKCLFIFISHTFMTSKKINKYAKMFRKLDKNNDGVLNYKEFYNFYRLIYPFKNKKDSKIESIKLFKSIDLNEDKKVEYSEFLNLLMINEIKKNKEIIQKTFNYFDQNNDGYIDIDEFKYVFSEWELNPFEWEKIIKDIDKNKDNRIDINEFFEIFENKNYFQKLISQKL